jgi:hypothetical protein
MKPWIFIPVGLVLVVLVAGIIGGTLPATRTVRRTVEIPVSPERIWTVLLRLQDQPAWRGDLASVTVHDMTRGKEHWTEQPRRGPSLTFRTTQRTDTTWSLAYSGPAAGTWTCRIERLAPDRSRFHFEESSTVGNPYARLLARLFFDPDAFVDAYLAALERRVIAPDTAGD